MSISSRSRRWLRAALFLSLIAATAGVAHGGGWECLGARMGAAAPAEPVPAHFAPTPTSVAPKRVDVAFVLDTTGSMKGLLEGAKRKIWSIANQLASGEPTPEVRMALVGYRDRGDSYVTRVRDLTNDIDAIYADLQGFSADGGGDTPESVNQALHEAVTSLGWSQEPGVYKVIFLVGDAPPHLDYPEDVPYAVSLAQARQRGIVVNTVQCGSQPATATVWRAIAEGGAGHYASISSDGGMLALATPMDDGLAQLNRELAKTLVPYGADAEQAELVAKRDRALAATPSTAAARLGFLSKLGGRLNAGRADLVDAIAKGLVDLASIDEDELPEPVRALDADQRSGYVERVQAERKKIQASIDALSSSRDDYVRAELDRRSAAGDGDGFDRQVLDAVREQAAASGIAY